VVFKFYPDEAAALTAYKAGEVLGISHIDTDHLDQALQLPNLGIYSSLMPQYSLIFLNLQNPDLPFFQDKRVRQALLRGLNRSGMIDQLLHGQAVLANSAKCIYGSSRSNAARVSSSWTTWWAAPSRFNTFPRSKKGCVKSSPRERLPVSRCRTFASPFTTANITLSTPRKLRLWRLDDKRLRKLA